ncbi:serine/threonine kinase [Nitzschia inconspicua]|uniref:Serine/threonine kinase n=1 Tax=Nitzschia inconspicua TaxID=303405 RepID=A0A9K3K6R0_9STRA|nr:serine/threonine kinase [Nitzschia inconspicua]KAG7372410.1 serine/threonine kinase [Nitzschia inconspicua]
MNDGLSTTVPSLDDGQVVTAATAASSPSTAPEQQEIPPSNLSSQSSSKPDESIARKSHEQSETPSSRRPVCSRCHRPTPQACICEALPKQRIQLSATEIVILQHPLEIKQHKATANRSVPILDLCLSDDSLHLCVGRRLGEDINENIRKKLNDDPSYQPVLVFPKLNTDVTPSNDDGETKEKEIYSLNGMINKLKQDRADQKRQHDNVSDAHDSSSDAVSASPPTKKILLLVLDATWKYAREMHMANQKYRQYPQQMYQVALEEDDSVFHGLAYQTRRFEIRGKVSATGSKKAAHEEDVATTWMCTAECVSLIVSRLEEELGTQSMSAQELHETLMKPLDAMVGKWKAFLTSPKTRKHDLERGISKKEKRKRRQLEQQQQQPQQQLPPMPQSRRKQTSLCIPTAQTILAVMLCIHCAGQITWTKLVLAERAYPLGCSYQNRSYYDFKNTAFPPVGVPIKSTSDYLLVRRLGAGKFSDVFEAVDVQLERTKSLSRPSSNTDIDPDTMVVLKCLKPVAEQKIKREILVLQHASNLPNLARLLAIVVPPDYFLSPSPTAVSPPLDDSTSTISSSSSTLPNYVTTTTKKSLIPAMPTLVLEHAHGDWLCHPNNKLGGPQNFLSEDEIRFFIFHLLVALDSLHACGIMHRDVKPRNVLIDRAKKTLMLIDLGLADFFFAGDHRYNVRVASRHYKSPELLLGYEQYGTAIDLWGVGCILAGLLLRKEPFFRGRDNLDQLATIIAVLGTANLHLYMAKYQIEMTPDIRMVISKVTKEGGGAKIPWSSLLHDPRFTPSLEGLDLLAKLLQYDHDHRLTAKEAMQHPFFDPVRFSIEQELLERQERLVRTHPRTK